MSDRTDEVLASPRIGGRRRLGGDRPPPPDVAAALERARQDGYEAGFADGRAAAISEAQQAARHAAAGIEQAVTAARDAVATLADRDADELVGLALAIAEAVIGRTPHDGGAAVADRVRDELARLDDDAVVVLTSDDDAALVREVVTTGGAQVRVDPSLHPGEARIAGRWAEVELTAEDAWQRVRQALGEADT